MFFCIKTNEGIVIFCKSHIDFYVILSVSPFFNRQSIFRSLYKSLVLSNFNQSLIKFLPIMATNRKITLKKLYDLLKWHASTCNDSHVVPIG